MTTRSFRRLDYTAASPKALQAMLHLSGHAHKAGLGADLIELLSLRASQINGCGFCIDMHTKELRAAGVSEQKLYLLGVWRETSLYTPRERAALAWTEAVTTLKDGVVPEETYREVLAEFGEAGIADLTVAIVAINGWNRLNIAFDMEVGHYVPGSIKVA